MNVISLKITALVALFFIYALTYNVGAVKEVTSDWYIGPNIALAVVAAMILLLKEKDLPK